MASMCVFTLQTLTLGPVPALGVGTMTAVVETETTGTVVVVTATAVVIVIVVETGTGLVIDLVTDLVIALVIALEAEALVAPRLHHRGILPHQRRTGKVRALLWRKINCLLVSEFAHTVTHPLSH